jgi:hypothetical protein
MTEKLLIVDDEPDMLKLLSMIIKEKTPMRHYNKQSARGA